MKRSPMKRGTSQLKRTGPIKAKRSPKIAASSDEQRHKDALARLGCAVCWRLHGAHEPGPVELHHLRTGGWGKGNYKTLMPLCVEHHRGATGVHGLGTKGFYKHYGFDQADLLSWALDKLGQTGATIEPLV